MDELRNGDQELAYISLMKFLAVVEQLKAAPDYQNQKKLILVDLNPGMVKRALDSAENLKEALVQRYVLFKKKRVHVFYAHCSRDNLSL